MSICLCIHLSGSLRAHQSPFSLFLHLFFFYLSLFLICPLSIYLIVICPFSASLSINLFLSLPQQASAYYVFGVISRVLFDIIISGGLSKYSLCHYSPGSSRQPKQLTLFLQPVVMEGKRSPFLLGSWKWDLQLKENESSHLALVVGTRRRKMVKARVLRFRRRYRFFVRRGVRSKVYLPSVRRHRWWYFSVVSEPQKPVLSQPRIFNTSRI